VAILLPPASDLRLRVSDAGEWGFVAEVSTERSRIRFRDMAQSARTVSGDFDLTMDELRVVARYVVRHAEDVLSVFEQAVPDDPRPRAAIDAAWAFINGANRTKLQRVSSLDAHRAARSAPSEAARLAARSAGDAASAAYLHPIAQAGQVGQVGHILRASASAARIGEMEAGGDPAIGNALLERSRQRATPVLIDVLRRYPPATSGSNRVAQLMSTLDHSLRQPADRSPGHTALSRADAHKRECKS
jgi:Imm-5 like putative immunity protein